MERMMEMKRMMDMEMERMMDGTWWWYLVVMVVVWMKISNSV